MYHGARRRRGRTSSGPSSTCHPSSSSCGRDRPEIAISPPISPIPARRRPLSPSGAAASASSTPTVAESRRFNHFSPPPPGRSTHRRARARPHSSPRDGSHRRHRRPPGAPSPYARGSLGSARLPEIQPRSRSRCTRRRRRRRAVSCASAAQLPPRPSRCAAARGHGCPCCVAGIRTPYGHRRLTPTRPNLRQLLGEFRRVAV